ncbi:hypothetical protein CRI70_13790 [Streptomyces sp. Ru87]|nr:hypothetical protein CRI70_13790 [Streptomyces sp. Ru87]
MPRPVRPSRRPADDAPDAGQREGRTGRGIGAWARRLAGGGRPAARPGPEETAPPERDPYDRWATAEAAEANRRWPDPSEILLTALGPGPRLWERGPGHPDALVVRLGTADRRTAPAVPVTVDLRRTGSLGLAGPRARLTGLARSVVAQLAALHSPTDLELVLISTDRGRDARQRIADWSWLGWLPQLRPAHGQDCRLLLAYDREQATARIAELVRRLDEAPPPGTGAAGSPPGPHTGPYTVMIVDGDPGSASLREATVRLAASGRSVGIHLLCLVETPAASPTAPLLANFEAARASSPAFGECGAVAMLSGDVATGLRVIHLPTAPQRGHSASGAAPTTSGTGSVRPETRPRPGTGPAGAGEPAGTGRDPGPYGTSSTGSYGTSYDNASPGTSHETSPGTSYDTSAGTSYDTSPGASYRTSREAADRARAAAGSPDSGPRPSGVPGAGGPEPHPAPGAGRPPHGAAAPSAHGTGGRPDVPDNGTAAVADSVSGAWAERFARSLAPLRAPDAGSGTAGPGGSRRVAVALPRSARLLDELGLARTTPASLTARWAAAADAGRPAGGRVSAVLGAGPHGPLAVDVAAEGPHLLIEGGPGTGKTELLRALAASLAAADRPDRLALLLVDGGGVRSSLPEPRGDLDTSDGGLRACTDLPHVSTYLPGVDPVRMRAFAQALSSELKRRAQLFGELDFTAWHDRRARAGSAPPGPGHGGAGRPAGDGGGDLEPEPSGTLRLRARRAAEDTEAAAASRAAEETGPDPVPRLVVLVDDFDALLAPALGSTGRPAAGSVVRALESVARHGARLGVHLVASSGRPERTSETAAAEAAGLRVALEVLPARTDGPERAEAAPGRGRLTRRDGTVTPFQAGRVTGRIPRTATQRPTVVPLEWDRMGDPPARRPVRELGNGPTDLALLASALQRAARSAEVHAAPPLI